MNKLDNQPYRGTRDFKPADMRRQNYIFDTWRTVCKRFGYEEYLTPLLEPMELYTAKTSEEIVDEQSYSFTDRGDRKVTIRPEMTPSVARLVSQDRLENGYPLRLFSVANYMRYERPQKGRLREFWQLNADMFGFDQQHGDLETVKLADELMKAFGADNSMYEIRVSHRSLLSDLADELQVDGAKLTRLIDSHDKMEPSDFNQRLKELGANQAVIAEFMAAESLDGLPVSLQQSVGVDRLQSLSERLDLETIVIDQTIARGFDYYTGMVFEVFDKNPKNNRSLFGGGRYDALLENFGVEPLPTVGFGMGDAVLAEFLDGHDLWPESIDTPSTQIWIINDNQDQLAELTAAELRNQGVNVAIDYSGRKVGKQIKTADTHGIPYVLFIGEDNHGLKNLHSGDQEDLSITEIVERVNG